ncbi:uncharacterized protein EI90DRAFT_3045098 [Cantharellus anzutake]|uniref:uncharacterized protein n=1 Tax=Cantharellus anzutake TaxID=1750568 RepID=UPI0019082069|nr:uncharacterized protein EI90DRAFT_3045098 [Cantharellus anzutake]KAF8336265.1 hypothetical protein EI90DRAFT_3045098 [Cantharellus anzutake]
MATCTGSISSSNPESNQEATTLTYEASNRAFISQTLEILGISIKELLDAERTLSEELYAHVIKKQESIMQEQSERIRRSKEEGWGGKWGRMAATVGGVALGGVAIGITGGLAAPVLLPLLPFISATAVTPAIVGGLFGLAGGGLTGYRVRKRWAGVQHFDFIELSGPNAAGSPGSHNVHESPSLPDTIELRETPRPKAPSLVASIIIPGIQVESEHESLDAAKACRRLFEESKQDLFVLSHSPDAMLIIGQSLSSWVKSQLVTQAKMEIIKHTALSAVVAAVSLPVSIYIATGLIVDNDWIRARDRAQKAAILLAEALHDGIQGKRPVTLIGFSLGALVLFEALLILDSKGVGEGGARGVGPLVDTAVLISLPSAPSKKEWRKARSQIGRRMVNAYCSNDFVLASVGRLHEVLGGANMGSIGGLCSTDTIGGVDGVENVDLSSVIEGHLDISARMALILEQIDIMA